MTAPVLTAAKIRHALRRKAHHLHGDLWRVQGAPGLDELGNYLVRYDPSTGEWRCSCRAETDNVPGIRTPGCVHVTAVVLEHRRRAAKAAAVADRVHLEEPLAARDRPLPS